MSEIQDWLDKYGESHQNKTNKLIHWFCVPIIFFTILGILSQVQITFLERIIPYKFANLASILVLFGILFYLKLSFVMFIGVAVFTFFCGLGIYFLNQTGYMLEICVGFFFTRMARTIYWAQNRRSQTFFFRRSKIFIDRPCLVNRLLI
jgi:uncharacterized membrane protein YGL010W